MSFDSGTNGNDQWQSFTAGITGKLSLVQFQTNSCPAYTYTFTIYAGAGTGGSVLYSGIFTNPGICNNWCPTNIPIGSAPNVSSGSQYTFRVQSSALGRMVANTSNGYGGGSYYSDVYGSQANWDCMFQTYVQQTTYPPASITPGGSTTFCQGGNVLLSANTGTFTYQWWNGVSAIGGATSQTFAATAPGPHQAIVTNTTTNCWNNSNVINVTVNPLPIATASNATVCTGSTATLNMTPSGGTPSYSYNWFNVATGGTSLATTANYNTPALTPAGTYTYYPEVTDANGCKTAPRPAVTVVANPLPNINVSGGPVLCYGGTANLTATGATTYTWNPGSLIGASQTLTAGSYTVTGNLSGCLNSQVYSLTQPPAALGFTPSGPTTVCSGATLNISLAGVGGTGPYTFTWLAADNPSTAGESTTLQGTSLINNLINSASTVPQVVSYTVTVTDANACTYSQQVNVTINPKPTMSSPISATICSGQTLNHNLTATVSGTFSWVATDNTNITGESTSPVVGPTINNTLTSAVQIAQAVSYTVTPTSSLGCVGNNQTITVTVNPAPIVTSASGLGICSGSSQGYNIVTNPAGGTVSWIAADNPNTSGESLTNQTTFTINNTLTSVSAAAENVSYTITPTSSLGCAGAPFVFITSVNPKPTMTSSTSQTICSGSATSVPLTSDFSSTYSWQATDNPNTSGESTSPQSAGIINNTITSSTLVSETVSYTVVPTAITGGCSGNPQTVNITVNPVPVLTSSFGTSVCSGVALNFPQTCNVASNFTWIATDNAATTGESLSLQSTSTINNTIVNSSSTAAQSVMYSVTPTSTLGCAGAVYGVTVTVNPSPTVTSPNTDVICSGGTLNHTLTASVSSTFQWIANNHPNTTGESTSLQSSPLINDVITSSSNAVSYVVVYTVTPTSSLSCVGPVQTINVSVNPNPVMTSAATATICSGGTESLAFTASASSNFSWIAADNPNTTGESLSSQSTSTLNNSVASTNTAAAEIVSYTVTPISTSSCTGIPQTVNVTVNPAPTVTSANAFTVCSGVGLNIPFSSSVASNYQWIAGDNVNTLGESLSTQTTAAITNTIVSSSAAGENISYTVTPTSSLGCPGTPQTLNVLVNPAPVMTSPNSGTICSGVAMNFPLTGNIASTYNWLATDNGNTTGESTSAQSFSTLNNTVASASSVPENISYTVTPTSSLGCVGAAQNVNINVNPAPIVTSMNTASTCEGVALTIPLTSNVSSTFSWVAADNPNIANESLSPQSSSTINDNFNSISLVNETVTYTITPTSLAGCTGIDQLLTVTVKPAPMYNGPASDGICSGAAVSVAASADIASTFSWVAMDNPNTTGESTTPQSSPVINDVITSSSSSQEFIAYSITPTANGCSGPPFAVNVTVDPAPVMTSPASGITCSGVALNIPLSSNIGGTFSWVATDNGNTTGESTAAQSFSSLNDNIASASSVPENISYTVTPTSGSGCPGAPQVVSITVNPAPVVTSTNMATVCSGIALNIPLAANIASIFSWVAGDNPNTLGEDILSQGTSLINNTIYSSSPVTQTVSYTVTPYSSAGCYGPAQLLTVNVDPAPNMTSPNNGSICSGNSVGLNLSSDIPATYNWMATDNASTTGESISPQSTSTIGDNITSASASSTTVQYTVTPTSTAGTCVGAPQTVSITVDPAPVMTNASSATICSGVPLSFAFSSTVVSNYQWIAADNANTTGESLGSQAGPSITDAVSSSSAVPEIVSYTVTPTSTAASCPGAPQVISVTVNPEPVMTSPGSATICSGDAVNINFSSTIPSTYTWLATDNTNTTGESTGPQTNPVLTDVISSASAVAQTVTYTVNPTSGIGCNGAAQMVNVTVNAIPAAPTVSGAGICDGTSASLTATAPGGTYDWYNVSSGGTSLFTGPNFVTPVLTVNTTYYVASTIAGCTGLRAPVTVTVSPNPSFTILAPSTICSGQDLNLGVVSLSGGSSFLYNWSGPNAFGSTLANPVRTAVLAADGGTYSLDIANEFSCVTTHTVLVTVQISPTAQITGPTSICFNQSATLSGTSSSANGDVITGYQWIQGTTAISGATSTSYVVTTAGSYYLEVTNSNGCKDTSLVSPLTVNALPIPVVGGPAAFCSGAGFSLNGAASGAGGSATFSSFEWLLAGTTVPGATTISENFTVGGSYQLVIINSNGCSDTSGAYVVTENFPPAAPAVTFSNTNYCQGDSIQVSINSPAAGHTYSWTVVPPAITIANPSATSTYVHGEAGGAYTVNVTDTDGNGCISAATNTNVQVNALPAVGVSASSTSVCTGASVTLNGTGANSYIWSGGISDGVAFVPAATLTYTVTGTDLNGCINTATQLITVNAPPTVTASATSTSICPGTSTTLNAGGTATSFSWSGGAGSGASVSVSPTVNTTYTVTGSDASTCTATATVAISLLPQPATPVASSSASSACAGIPVLLSSSSAIDNHWFNAASSAVIINTAASFNQTETTAGSYSYGLYTQAPGGCSSDTAYVPVTFNSCLSSLADEFLSLVANGTASGNVMSNDGNPAGYTVNTTPLAGPLFGSFNISGTGAFTYTPNSGYSGVDMIVVQACDVSSNCLNDTIFVVIIPAANNDFGTVSGLIPNSQLTGNVLVNDAGTGISGNATMLSNVSHGTLTFAATGDFTYIPNTGYCGLDSFRYQVCDITSLCNTAYCVIDVNCDVALDTHTGFSPNGDGKNDLWVIGNIDFTENQVTIYDRWGNEIWKAVNYDNTSVAWDGKNKNGEELSSGTYFYLIEVKDKPAVRGWVEITK
jgi:gliding motility-associated-like protein